MPSSTSRKLKPHPPLVACFGEVLWDCLPRGIFIGGAPLNVAVNLHRLGLRTMLVSATGRDFLGEELRRRLARIDFPLNALHLHPRRPTGTVDVVVDKQGVASYTIRRGVAWDKIPESAAASGPEPDAVVFGSLALRTTYNRRSLDALLRQWPQALRVADINLRPPDDTIATIDWLLGRAEFLKLNEHELTRLLYGRARAVRPRDGHIEAAARALVERTGVSKICVTAGGRGAGVLWDGQWFWENARPVTVRDTVGAGDAFLAGFLAARLMRGASVAAALKVGCRLGEYVASRDGATPDLPLSKQEVMVGAVKEVGGIEVRARSSAKAKGFGR